LQTSRSPVRWLLLKETRGLLSMNQPARFRFAQGCAWPDPKHPPSFTEFLRIMRRQVVAWEATAKRNDARSLCASSVQRNSGIGWTSDPLRTRCLPRNPMVYDRHQLIDYCRFSLGRGASENRCRAPAHCRDADIAEGLHVRSGAIQRGARLFSSAFAQMGIRKTNNFPATAPKHVATEGGRAVGCQSRLVSARDSGRSWRTFDDCDALVFCNRLIPGTKSNSTPC